MEVIDVSGEYSNHSKAGSGRGGRAYRKPLWEGVEIEVEVIGVSGELFLYEINTSPLQSLLAQEGGPETSGL